MERDLVLLVGNRLRGIIRSERIFSYLHIEDPSKPKGLPIPYTLRDLVRVSLTSVKAIVRNSVQHRSSIKIGSVGKLVAISPPNISFEPEPMFRRNALEGKPTLRLSLDFWKSYLHRGAGLIDSTLEDAVAASVEMEFPPFPEDDIKLASHIVEVMCEAIRVFVCFKRTAIISVIGEFAYDPTLGVRYSPDPLLVNTALLSSKPTPWDPKQVEILGTDILEHEDLEPGEVADIMKSMNNALKVETPDLEEKVKQELERQPRKSHETE